ncbi:MAG: glycoside hydrolase family 3 protein [Oscillospiraceae bacterium]|nr:glycoside hydrolase family 3 protein [Oscillospiraceae bacterium]
MAKKKRKIKFSNIAALVLTFAAVLLLVYIARGLVPTGIDSGESTTSSTAEATTVTTAESTVTTTDATTVSTEATTEATTEAEPHELTTEERALEILSGMSLEEQVYQLFIVRPEQITGSSTKITEAGSDFEEGLSSYPVGGIAMFAENIIDREQTIEMISDMQSYSTLGLFIAVDEEGGTVARIGNNSAMGTTSFPSMKTVGNTGDTDEAYNVGYTIGTEILELGFNLDFAPVADVDSNPNNTVIGNRAFSTDADIAAEMVAAAVEGFNDSGILCTLKHFPGHGDTSTDSHLGYTELDKSLAELWETEFVPFASGIEAGADLVMVGHISVPQVTGDDTPASLSATMINILREDLGFDGLIITDSMQMEAITDRYTSAEAAVLAIQAGVDIILMPENLEEAANGIIEAVENEEISEERIAESVLKILEVKIEAGII